MEDDSTEEITDSDFSDSFIASDDDYEDGLNWDSDDSRPPGPSPPASANMSESSPDPPVSARLTRRRNRRLVFIEPDTQSDDGSDALSQVDETPQDPPGPPENVALPAIQQTSGDSQPNLTKASAPEPILNNSMTSESDDNSLCSICMDPLTNSGKHRVVCLRCGHIFGSSCLERWIKVGCSNGAKRCPTCNKKACLKDIRVLYLAKVVPLDTVERDRLIQEKEELASQKKVMEMELSRCKLQNELRTKRYEANILRLEEKLYDAVNAMELLKQGKKIVPLSVDVSKDCVRAKLLHSVDISKDGGCRVLAFNPLLQELIVSQPSGNTIFAGYGVRVLNTVDFMPVRFIFLHQKVIRDLAFHPEDRDLLLSVSLDQTAKLVDLASSTTVHTFKGEGPLWSCCWDVTNPHLMFVGGQQGKVWQYDRRMMDTPCNLWHDQNNLTPVVALAAAPSLPNTAFPQGGFISCRLNAVFAYARFGDTYKRQELPLEGPFMNMRYDYSKQNLLTTSRPSSRCPYVRINLNEVDVDNGNVCLPQIHSFNCGSSARVLSRLTTMPTLNDSLIVAHHESGRTVNVWSSKTGNLETSFPVKEPVIDLTGLTFNNSKTLLATLSDKKVGIYKVS